MDHPQVRHLHLAGRTRASAVGHVIVLKSRSQVSPERATKQAAQPRPNGGSLGAELHRYARHTG